MTVPIIVEHSECLVQTNGANNLGSYVGRLACLLYQCMGNKLLTEINRIKPATVGTIREYLVANTWHLTRDVTTAWRHVATVIRSSYSARVSCTCAYLFSLMYIFVRAHQSFFTSVPGIIMLLSLQPRVKVHVCKRRVHYYSTAYVNLLFCKDQ